jgi:glycosyltransferase involved in cell wall biosynthesis
MKVLMLGWELPPHNSGGLGVACYQLCEALSKNDVDLEFVLPYQAEHNITFMNVRAARPAGVIDVIKSGIAYDSYKYVYRDGHEEYSDIYSQVRFYEQAVSDLAKNLSFDIVHAHDWLTFRAALRIKQDKGCPIILHVHSIESDRAGGNKGNPLVREIEETSMLYADSIIAVSEFTKRRICSEYAIPEDKVEVVHNSVDRSALEAPSKENAYRYLNLLKQNGYKVVTNVGRLTVQKGLVNFLQAAKMVTEHIDRVIFLIVGAGEQYQELVTLAAELGIGDKVIFSGFLRGKDWRDSYSIADLFVMPSVSEPFGITPLEAGFYGVPSLISKQSGVAEVLNNCLKVDFWDINEMANKIVGALRDDPLRDTMRESLDRELNTFSWDLPASKVKNLYNRHLEGAGA